MQKKKYTLWETIKTFFLGGLFLYVDYHWTPPVTRLVYYKFDDEWDLHVFDCPSLDWNTTVHSKFTQQAAWEIAQERLSTGLH